MGLAWRFLVCVLLTVSGGLPLHALAASVILIASDESGAFNEAAEAIAQAAEALPPAARNLSTRACA